MENTGETIVSRHIKVYEQPGTFPDPDIADNHEKHLPLAQSNEAIEKELPDANQNLEPKLKDPPTTHPIRQSKRGRIPKKHFPIESNVAVDASHSTISIAFHAQTFLYYEPKTFKEAMASDEGEFWRKATDEEMQSHRKNNTWTIVPLPPNKTCISSGWNFKIKTGKDGPPTRRKARFFAKGYSQVKGIDFQESFATVVRYDSLRVVIAIAAASDLELFQLDVKTAFLNGEVDEEICIAQPEGYIEVGRERRVQTKQIDLQDTTGISHLELEIAYSSDSIRTTTVYSRPMHLLAHRQTRNVERRHLAR